MAFWRILFLYGVTIQALAGFWSLAMAGVAAHRLVTTQSLPDVPGAAYYRAGQLLICVPGIVAAVYDCLPFIGCHFFRFHAPGNPPAVRRRNLVLQLWLLGSLILTVAESIGIRLQVIILPPDCEHSAKSPLLTQLGSIVASDEKHPAKSVCESLRLSWRWTLPLVVFSGLVIVSGVFSFLESSPTGSWPDWRPGITIPWPAWMVSGVRRIKSPLKFAWRCWCRSWPLAVVISLFTVLLPFILVTVWAIELVKQYSQKEKKKNDASSEISWIYDIDLEVFNPPLVEHTVGPSPFEKAMTVDDIFFSFAEFTHGRDLHALAGVSRSTNSIVKRHWKHNKNSLHKRLCCNSGRNCYYCSIPVCEKCKGLSYLIQQTTKEMQRRTLQVMCSRCYMAELYTLNHFASLNQRCRGNHHNNVFTDDDNNRWIWICKKCNEGVEGIKKAEEVREKYAKTSGVELNSYSHHKCFACERNIWRTSLRWWRCTECGLECRDRKF